MLYWPGSGLRLGTHDITVICALCSMNDWLKGWGKLEQELSKEEER